ncbi:TPA: hypothetical protein HA238_02065 [Candidatus Micrarchaeota archaeon]|nr:hypothetical protein [Candidatus Micrarchaeota archaeon]
MTIETCERCGKQTVKLSTCKYCKKKMCVSCIKNTKKVAKTTTVHICKGCWTNMKTRSEYKSYRSAVDKLLRPQFREFGERRY